MVGRTPAMAKFARPNTKGVHLRESVFGLLNGLLGTPVIWIQSPAGAGKTTLISSYLETYRIRCLWYQVDEGDSDLASFFYHLRQALQSVQSKKRAKPQLPLLRPEYLTSIPLFTRRFFAQLFEELEQERVVVFDNYQTVPHGDPFHKAIIHGLEAIPQGKQVIFISREAPPGIFARLKANDAMALLTWDQLRLSLNDSMQIAELRGYHHLNKDQIARVHRTCEGWAAGLVLLLKVAEYRGTESNLTSRQGLDDIFNYFAGEVFERMEPDVQDLLLKTAYLPKVHAEHAGRLAENPDAQSLLLKLSSNQYFVMPYNENEPLYYYHQLFRRYLMAEAERSIDRESRAMLQRSSARLLLESGSLEDAASLLILAEDWPSLSQVILENAQNLIDQGRNETLASWINSLPAMDRAGSPWMSYWLGACQLTGDLEGSRQSFIAAFEHFKRNDDPAGMYTSWSSIIETFVYEWGDMTPMDRWIQEIAYLLERYPLPKGPIEAKVASAMFCALVYRRPQHPDIGIWEERVKQLILHVEDAQLKIMLSTHLMLYYTWWIGGQDKSAFLVDVLQAALMDRQVAPLHYIVWRSMEGASSWMYNRFSQSQRALTDGLETAAKTGVHVWDFMLLANMVYWHLCQQKIEEADTYLHEMRFILETRRYMDISHYHYLKSYAQLCKGNLQLALDHIQAAMELADKAGCPFPYYWYMTGKADILIEAGEFDEAGGLLRSARRFGQQMGSTNLTYQTSWLRALIHYRRGEKKKTHDHLRDFLENSRKNSTVNHAFWRSEVMARLFAEALTAGIEVDHVKRLIREHGMVAPDVVPIPESWPFQVRIYTLGRFSLLVDDQPISLEIKGKNKPLLMLKALIAPKGHDMSDVSLSDDLWPDAEGDRALQNFTITLHRLRKLIGYPQAILLKDRRVCLNPKLCWVDIWVLEDLLIHAETALVDRKINAKELQSLGEKLQAVYKGLFLHDEQRPWAIGFRRRLQSRWSQIAEQLGESLERDRLWAPALELYRHALQIEQVSEWACQGAMRCGLALGRIGQAMTAYDRTKSALWQTCGSSPSPQTDALLRQLKTNSLRESR